jgi:hypothetical protein
MGALRFHMGALRFHKGLLIVYVPSRAGCQSGRLRRDA